MAYPPLYSSLVSAGFPSPADDWIEAPLDLNTLLIKRPSATFFIRVKGDSMRGAGIEEGDILVVDRSIRPSNNMIVIAAVNGELTVKRLIRRDGTIQLIPDNPRYKAIDFTPSSDLRIWGVVTAAVKRF